MRKIIMIGTLITLFGAGALAQAKDITTTEAGGTAEATRPAARGADDERERHFESRSERREARRSHRQHPDEARERHDERWEHGRRHH